MTTPEIREAHLVANLFVAGKIELAYAEVERTVIGSAIPVDGPLELPDGKPFGTGTFCERREMGVINIGGPGAVEVDGARHEMASRDGLYIGRGSAKVRFISAGRENPAAFYLVSYPAHATHPTAHIRIADVEAVKLGAAAQSNVRTIYKYVHPDGVKSCQLMLGLTELAPGNVWNTMPPHLHARRSEIYFYFNLAPEARVFHFMGDPVQTRHLVVGDRQAVISPAWSIHCGAGTSSYSFIWAMGGENQLFSDMDMVKTEGLR